MAIIEGILPVSKSEPRFYVRAHKVISFFCPLLFPFFESKWCWAGAMRLGDRDGTCVAQGQREECGEEKHREMSRTDVTKGITWKKDGGKRGEGDVDGSERAPASEEDGARMIYMSELCVCVCDSPSHPTEHAPPCSLHSFPIHFRPFLFSFFPSLPHWLFTLTVIWQVQGWQTWRRQGKRLSGLALLGSCWLAVELAVRLRSCDRPGDWWGSEGELSLRWCDRVG